MKSFGRILIAATLICLPSAAFASGITLAPYVQMTGLVTFEDVAVDNSAPFGLTNYNGIVTSGGQSFAERFVGQTLGAVTIGLDEFDTLAGPATGPLLALSGLPSENLAVFNDLSGHTLAGVGPQGFDNNGIGNGAIAMLFATNQSYFGFEVLGGNGNPNITDAAFIGATVSVFARDGSLIDTILVGNLGDPGFYGFSRTGGIKDIAGFSVTNNDLNGISFDNITFGDPVPEPSTLALVGIAGLFLVRRRTRA